MLTRTSTDARANALFVSTVQASDQPNGATVRAAIYATITRFGYDDLAATVAGEFGDHPDTAVRRMEWALHMVRTCYPLPVNPALSAA